MVRLAIAAAALVLAAAGCGSDDTGGADSAAAPTGASGTDTGATASSGPCAVVPDSAVATVFTGVRPELDAKDLTKGFATCTWTDANSELIVSIVPKKNLQSDYKDQLNVSGPVQSSVFADGVSFPGTVAIGKANAKGTTVGFTSGDSGYLVAVRTGKDGDPKNDLPLATGVADQIAQSS
jgi:hypothetical protein